MLPEKRFPISLQAGCYQITGDSRYSERCRDCIEQYDETLFRSDVPHLDGYGWNINDRSIFGYAVHGNLLGLPAACSVPTGLHAIMLPKPVKVSVPKQERGKVWAVSLSNGMRITGMRGVPPFVGMSPSAVEGTFSLPKL